VGAIYMSASATPPGDLFGGTWIEWGEGRVPVGVGYNGTSATYYALGATGGGENRSYNLNSTGSSYVEGWISASGGLSSYGYNYLNHEHIPYYKIRQIHIADNEGVTGRTAGVEKDGVTFNRGSETYGREGNRSTGGPWMIDTYEWGRSSPAAVEIWSYGESTFWGYNGINGSANVDGTVYDDTMQPYQVCHMWRRLTLAPLNP